MSKLKCNCGHTIVDQTNDIPYKGHILPDTLVDKVSDSIIDSIDRLADATNSNRRMDWIKENFSVPPYPTDIKDSGMIFDLISSKLVEIKQDIYECENCGRIAIEIGQTNQFKFFSPDTKDNEGILNGKN